MRKYDGDAFGRALWVCALTGVVIGPATFAVYHLGLGHDTFFTGMVTVWIIFVVIGAFTGTLAGLLAGSLLLVAGPRLRETAWAARSAGAAACATGFTVPLLLAGLGISFVYGGAWTPIVLWVVAVAAVVGGFAGPYLSRGSARAVEPPLS
ncbi:hypothetical protein [Actinoplanes sp. GCM10030250]|uniref:hypothetical protein n=1 Tax=Actinoplanes sp. GCM10030250 TaxID=3273376 RepID=UPI00361B19AA